MLLFVFAAMQLSAGPGPAESAKKKKKKSSNTEISELRLLGRAGLNLSNMSIDEAGTNTSMLPGFHIGVVGQYSLNEMFALEGGLLLSSKGCKSDYEVSQNVMGMSYTIKADMKINPLYLEIPVNAVVRLPLGSNYLFFAAGPYLGMGIGGKNKADLTVESNIPGFDPSMYGFTNIDESIKYGSDEESTMKRMDFGLNLGAGIEMNSFQVRLQYGIGLSNLSTVDGQTIKNQVLGISLGYVLPVF